MTETKENVVSFKLSLAALARAAMIGAVALALTACAERFSRDDFASRIRDKAEHEVRKDIGKPAEVDASDDRVRWIYVGRTFNIEDGNKFDNRTVVVFTPSGPERTLRVAEVLFE